MINILYFEMIFNAEFWWQYFFGIKLLFVKLHIKTIQAIQNNTGILCEHLLSHVDFKKFVGFAQSVHITACENEKCFVLSFMFIMS